MFPIFTQQKLRFVPLVPLQLGDVEVLIVLLCGLRLGTATLRTEARSLLSMMIQHH
jgi:hypothetical protein